MANNPELQNAEEWLEVELPVHRLGFCGGRHSLVEIRGAALRIIRDAAQAELDRLGNSSRRRTPVKSVESPAPRRLRRV